MRKFSWMILLILMALLPSRAYAQVDFMEEIMDDILLIESSGYSSGIHEPCGPCIKTIVGDTILDTRIRTGIDTLTMPGQSWVGNKYSGDSCKVIVYYSIYDCIPHYYYPVLVPDSIHIMPCCNAATCKGEPSLILGPNQFSVSQYWMDAVITQIIAANTGDILTLASTAPMGFSVITKTCYQGITNDVSGSMGAGAKIIACTDECCSISFTAERKVPYECAYFVTGVRNTEEFIKCPSELNNPFFDSPCGPQCRRPYLYGMENGKFVVVED